MTAGHPARFLPLSLIARRRTQTSSRRDRLGREPNQQTDCDLSGGGASAAGRPSTKKRVFRYGRPSRRERKTEPATASQTKTRLRTDPAVRALRHGAKSGARKRMACHAGHDRRRTGDGRVPAVNAPSAPTRLPCAGGGA